MTLFDMMGGGEEAGILRQLPDVGEYEKEQLLVFEKEVLGIYVSGHPLEEYEDMLEKEITQLRRISSWTRRAGVAGVTDGATAVIGGMIEKDHQVHQEQPAMAFLPWRIWWVPWRSSYSRRCMRSTLHLEEDAKVFIEGGYPLRMRRPAS